MPMNFNALEALASEYTKPMTSIRGRRVQRLLKREFAGAEYVLLAQVRGSVSAVLGLSDDGAALCATDGTGKEASVVKWLHGSAVAFEARFDLHKDSLPLLSSNSVSLRSLRAQAPVRVTLDSAPAGARPLVVKVLEVLG